MRNSTRRRLLLEQYDRKDVIDCFRQMMNKHHTLLERDLRRSTLRRRLAKANCDLDKSIEFDWSLFSEELSKTIVSALTLVVKDVYEIESSYWQARNKTTKNTSIIEIISQYELRTGHKISKIGLDLKSDILVRIVEWYDTKLPFAHLIKTIAYYFSIDLLNSIMNTEIAHAISQISLNNMLLFGASTWDYEPLVYGTLECLAYATHNPYTMLDKLPPICAGDRGLVTYRGNNV